MLDFGISTCGIRVKLNGYDLGERIAVSYAFDVSEALKVGENTLEIVVTTTLGLKKKDRDTHFGSLVKYALIQKFILGFYKSEYKLRYGDIQTCFREPLMKYL